MLVKTTLKSLCILHMMNQLVKIRILLKLYQEALISKR